MHIKIIQIGEYDIVQTAYLVCSFLDTGNDDGAGETCQNKEANWSMLSMDSPRPAPLRRGSTIKYERKR